MSKKEQIVESFLSKGVLLTPQALEEIEKEPSYVNRQYSEFILTPSSLQSERIITSVSPSSELSTEDFVSYYRDRYEKLSKIIHNRIKKDFISINKISGSGTFYVIAIVKSINRQNNQIDIEDFTGKIKAKIDEKDIESIEVDDVLAFRISSSVIQEVYFPDAPLRPPSSGIGRAFFLPELCISEAPEKEVESVFRKLENQEGIMFIFEKKPDIEKISQLVNKYCKKMKRYVVDISSYPAFPSKGIMSNPLYIEVNKIKFLLTSSKDVLKKRHIGKIITSSIDSFVLEEIPDIIFSPGPPLTKNYKSTTLVSTGSLLSDPRIIIIDLSSREISKL